MSLTRFTLKKPASLLAPMLLLGVSGITHAMNQKSANSSTAVKEQVQPSHPWDKKIYLNGITITPGGFFAGEGLWRSRTTQSDMGTSFGAIPVGTSPLYYMNETRFSARFSRISALVEGTINPTTLISGYLETDFLGNGTANENESNSFDLRVRNFYANVDWLDVGWHLLAGQSWSLITLYSKGITPRSEALPPSIDAQYVPGFVWKRQAQFRVTKNFGEQVWLAISAENPQYTEGGSACGVVGGTAGTSITGTNVTNQYCFAPGTGTLPGTTNFSVNKVPDVIGKLVFESTIKDHKIHLEGMGLYRQFYDRVYTTLGKNNMTTSGWGAGSGAFIEVLPKLLDFQGSVLFGRGIGTYGTSQLPDTTLALDGSLTGIPEVIFLAGATVHATPLLDLYVFGGKEQEQSKYFNVGSNYYGYGVPNANNTGCTLEGGVCAGNTKEVWQITAGLWDKLYKGGYGELKGGLQYSYTQRILFGGTGSTNPLQTVNYNSNDNMVFFSLRYYPFTPSEVKSVAGK
jgi:hypothetical protein